jgi:hypothetical protein
MHTSGAVTGCRWVPEVAQENLSMCEGAMRRWGMDEADELADSYGRNLRFSRVLGVLAGLGVLTALFYEGGYKDRFVVGAWIIAALAAPASLALSMRAKAIAKRLL